MKQDIYAFLTCLAFLGWGVWMASRPRPRTHGEIIRDYEFKLSRRAYLTKSLTDPFHAASIAGFVREKTLEEIQQLDEQIHAIKHQH